MFYTERSRYCFLFVHMSVCLSVCLSIGTQTEKLLIRNSLLWRFCDCGVAYKTPDLLTYLLIYL